MSERRLKPSSYLLEKKDQPGLTGILKDLNKEFLSRFHQNQSKYTLEQVELITEVYSTILLEMSKIFLQNLRILKLPPAPIVFSTKLSDRVFGVLGTHKHRPAIFVNFPVFVDQMLKFPTNPDTVIARIRQFLAHETYHIYTQKYYPKAFVQSARAYSQIEDFPEIYKNDRGELAANLYAHQHLQEQQTDHIQYIANLDQADQLAKFKFQDHPGLKPASPPEDG